MFSNEDLRDRYLDEMASVGNRVRATWHLACNLEKSATASRLAVKVCSLDVGTAWQDVGGMLEFRCHAGRKTLSDVF